MNSILIRAIRVIRGSILFCVLGVSAFICLCGCQAESIILPDGARFDRFAIGTKLDVKSVDVVKTADGFTAHVSDLNSDAEASFASAMQAVAEIAAVVLKGLVIP